MDLEWKCLEFQQLNVNILYRLLKLRGDVFVVEQQCPYADLDGLDTPPGTRHLLGRESDSGELMAYLRILPPGLVFPEVGLGRFVVSGSCRGKRLGHQMLDQAFCRVRQLWPGENIRISAQVYLKKFYASHGFIPISQDYVEDGIPHVDMFLDVSPDGK